MMDYVLVAIKDAKSRSWNPPAVESSKDSALRSFGILCNDGKSLPSLYPADFDLWLVGAFSSDTGVVTNCQPTHLANGEDVRIRS